MKDFEGKIAVITGGGTGMGRELARQLARDGCHVAVCDISVENMEETQALCRKESPEGTRFSLFQADVSQEDQVMAFRDHVASSLETSHINLLFNNAGVGGGGSFIDGEREEWDLTFGVCWGGVYNGSRAFVPMLVASEEGHLINTSSVNGMWASLGPQMAHTAYSSAKFAVKGFTEALVNDFKLHAPHVGVSLVMPGHVGTSIVINSGRFLGQDPKEMTDQDLDKVRERLITMGMPVENVPNEMIRMGIIQRGQDFRDKAPLTAADAATIILDGVRARKWRILVGHDAEVIDRMVRETPEEAYGTEFMERLLAETQWDLAG
ncbi:MAG: short-chain dehydrogenase [Spirochaeta sp.]|nr:short-chain dehydrogenase [Spirochaeta sp.]RPG13671.1 MAG: SDR family NAD(P)-dependent oxidoreductase [Proteobacteria bacterium TMED72]